MAEKRYFWLKLYDDFFSSKRIKRLRNLAGGDTYTIIYLKMQLKALKTDGYLYFDGIMNDFAEELALDIDENSDDVKVTIQYLISVGLLETNDGEQYKLPFLDKCIGSESAHAQRQREYIKRKKESKASLNDASVTQLLQIDDAEKDIEKDIEKELDIEKENIQKKESSRFVPPTIEEVRAYCLERNNDIDPENFVDFYTSKNWMVGKTKMKDWKASVRTWERNKKNRQTSYQPKQAEDNWDKFMKGEHIESHSEFDDYL